MVFYRKYRPQKIDDLDNAIVRESLTSILGKSFSKSNDSSGKSQESTDTTIPHAFLFTGPKGLGKTSSARIIAKIVNCTGIEKKRIGGFEPCDTCENCTSISDGNNMDILEIDAASNRGIDEIRDLKEKIRLSPLSSKMKVYIIDEVHMLTTEAFNALLKTLEEPPAHAMFILATTEPQKVPATILSRCFHIQFKKATEDELVRSFQRIAKGEKIKISKDALSYIAGLSDGSFRDGAKILEEMSLLVQTDSSQSVTKELIEKKYQVISIVKNIEDLLNSLSKKDVNNALLVIGAVVDQGIDVKYFTQKLTEYLHEELLSQVQNGKSEYFDFDVMLVKSLVEIIGRAYQEMRYAVLVQLPLELAIIEWCQGASYAIAEVDGKYVKAEIDGVSVVSLRKQAGNIKKINAMYGTTDKKPQKVETEKNKEADFSLLHVASGEITKEWLDMLFKNIISEMKTYNHTASGVLRGCRIAAYDEKKLIIETGFKFHKERLDDLKTRDALSRICKLLTGKDIKVEVQLINK